MGTMKAVWLENNQLTIKDHLPIPILSENEALIKVQLTGICATDLELVKGYYPFAGILGHEFVGVVIQAAGTSDIVGKRVVGEINISCNHCQACKAGLFTHCENRSVLGIKNWHGSFAQYLHLPIRNLNVVPTSISDDAAVFTEPLAAALEIQEQVQFHPSDHVVIIGAGRLGLLIAQTIRLIGCDLIVVARREKPKSILNKLNIKSILPEDLPAKRADIVIDASGNEEGLLLACKAVRPKGKIVIKSTYKGTTQINLSSLVVDEISIIGSRCGPFQPAIDLLNKGLVDPQLLIDKVYPLSDGLQAFDHAAQPGALKILLNPFE